MVPRMEEVELTRITQLEDVPNELIQRIQSLLFTLLRDSRDNLPITNFKLHIVIEDGKSVSVVKKWIRHLISKSLH